jgi:hypothetical protein
VWAPDDGRHIETPHVRARGTAVDCAPRRSPPETGSPSGVGTVAQWRESAPRRPQSRRSTAAYQWGRISGVTSRRWNTRWMSYWLVKKRRHTFTPPSRTTCTFPDNDAPPHIKKKTEPENETDALHTAHILPTRMHMPTHTCIYPHKHTHLHTHIYIYFVHIHTHIFLYTHTLSLSLGHTTTTYHHHHRGLTNI